MRITGLPAGTIASNDYIAIDNTSNGTRKLLMPHLTMSGDVFMKQDSVPLSGKTYEVKNSSRGWLFVSSSAAEYAGFYEIHSNSSGTVRVRALDDADELSIIIGTNYLTLMPTTSTRSILFIETNNTSGNYDEITLNTSGTTSLHATKLGASISTDLDNFHYGNPEIVRWVGGTTLNAPNTSGQGWCINYFTAGGTIACQIAKEVGSDLIYQRNFTGGAWSGWRSGDPSLAPQRVLTHDGANSSSAYTMTYSGLFQSGILITKKINMSASTQVGLYLVGAYLRTGSSASSNKAYVIPIVEFPTGGVSIAASTTEQAFTITVNPGTTYVSAWLYKLS